MKIKTKISLFFVDERMYYCDNPNPTMEDIEEIIGYEPDNVEDIFIFQDLDRDTVLKLQNWCLDFQYPT